MPTAARAGTHRPALQKLGSEQRELTREFIDGFVSYRGMVEWLHDFLFLSLGHAKNDFLRKMAGQNDPFARAFAWAEPADHYDGDLNVEELTDEALRETRRKVAAEFVTPEFSDAVDEFWADVTQYGENPPDPSVAEYTAMRPGLDDLRKAQEESLSKILDGFESRDESVEWQLRLNDATLGQHSKKILQRCFEKERVPQQCVFLDSEVNDVRPELARGVRIRIGGYYLLPWFNQGVRLQIEKAPEKPVEAEEELREYEITEEDLS